VAKQILTSREASELKAYVARNPIDDQSNHHVPIAYLHSQVANLAGGKHNLRDFLIFRPKSDDDDIDSQLISGKW
jgi:hypothetical protein